MYLTIALQPRLFLAAGNPVVEAVAVNPVVVAEYPEAQVEYRAAQYPEA
jgi:hypothetical protein